MEKKKPPLMVVIINSDILGRGDDGLGALLVGNFLTTLGEFLQDISHMLLVNEGVKPACADPDKADVLAAIEECGVEILYCGICMNHFSIRNRFKADRISNMFTIVVIQTAAGKVIAP